MVIISRSDFAKEIFKSLKNLLQFQVKIFNTKSVVELVKVAKDLSGKY